MYNPMIGRWMEEDPIEFQAGDANLYRDVANCPTNATDPSGLEEKKAPFTYTTQIISFFGRKLEPSGFSKDPDSRLYPGFRTVFSIVYPKKDLAGSGFFLQANKIQTVVVTKDGKVRSVPVKYVADAALARARPFYQDTNAGPKFEQDWGPDAVFVFSYVQKTEGFTADRPPEIDLRTIDPMTGGFRSVYWEANPDRYNKFMQAIDTNTYASGKLAYSYLYVNADNYQASATFKGKKLDAAIKYVVEGIGKVTQKGFETETFAKKFEDTLRFLTMQKKDLFKEGRTHLLRADEGKKLFWSRRKNVDFVTITYKAD